MAVLLLLGTSCSMQILRPPPIVLVDADQSVRVRVGESAKTYDAAWLAFFPDQVVIHPGDTVNFQVEFTGEPHTVTLGSLVDAAAAAIDALGRTATPQQVEALEEVKRLPHLLPQDAPDGPMRPNGSAAQPCFLRRGDPPNSRTGGARPCPDTDRPAFDGTQTFFNSGWMAEGDIFRVRFAPTIKPGTYHVLSLAHPWAPGAEVVVRKPSEPRPRAYDVKRTGRELQSRLLVTLEPAAEEASRAQAPAAVAGAGSADAHAGYLTSFIPRRVRARVSVPVTWRMFGLHSITFNHPSEAAEGILRRDDGRVRANRIAWEPAGSPPLPPVAKTLVAPEGSSEVVVDGGSWDGTGFRSSGVIASFPPAIVTYRLTFTEPGDYAYRCLVHDSMRGTVSVG